MNNQKSRRQVRTRHKIKSVGRPRVTVYRSNKFISAQVIDDQKNITIIGVNEKDIKVKGTKTEKARALGLLLAQKVKIKKVKKVVFDRGSYAYHGRVKQLAEGLREGGLEF